MSYEGRIRAPEAFATRTTLPIAGSLLVMSASLAAGLDARDALVLAVGAWMVGQAIGGLCPPDDRTRSGAPTFGSSAGPPDRSAAGALAPGGAAILPVAIERPKDAPNSDEPDTTVTEEDIDILTHGDPAPDDDGDSEDDETRSEDCRRRLVDICLGPDLPPRRHTDLRLAG